MAVTGNSGQVVTALRRAASASNVVQAIGRPVLDLDDPEGAARVVAACEADVIVNAAANTAVDRAESDRDAVFRVNALAAGAMARAAAARRIPFIQLSTDYVFSGDKADPYVETDPVGPTGVYGASKLAGEHAVAEAGPNHAILRTAWVFAPEGRNFLTTMIRLAETRETIGVVHDQRGNPTLAEDIATGIIRVARNLLARPHDPHLRGTFHMTASGEASWAEFAAYIFEISAQNGGRHAEVLPIPTTAYPTPARRPANSRLDCAKIAAVHGVRLPDWRDATRRCLAALAVSLRTDEGRAR